MYRCRLTKVVASKGVSRNNSIRRVVAGSVFATMACASLTLTACAGSDPGEAVPGGMGNAEPVPSKDQGNRQLPGTIHELAADVTGGILAGDTAFLRTHDGVLVGNPADPEQHVHIDAACGDLGAGGDIAVLPCEDGIHVISQGGTDAATIGQGKGYSSAVGLDDGRIIGHRVDSNRIDVYGDDGELAIDFTASRHGSQLVAVPYVPEAAGEHASTETMLAEINRPETSIHEIDLENSRSGNGLRAGLGVGPAVVNQQGVIAAADTKGNQLLIYTMTDVIRLHQATPTNPGPWALAWDESRNLIWVSSTEDRTLTAFDISSGTAVLVATIPTVADAQALLMTEAGDLYSYSASGGGVHQLLSDEIDTLITEQKAQAEADAEAKALREPVNRLPTGAGGTDESE